MIINTENLTTMTEANQNFSKVTKMVDENGMAIIMRNNKPSYVVVDFEEFEKISIEKRQKKISSLTSKLIDENLDAFKELAK